MSNRIASTMIVLAFFVALFPAPAALALRQTQEGLSAYAIGNALGRANTAGDVKGEMFLGEIPGTLDSQYRITVPSDYRPRSDGLESIRVALRLETTEIGGKIYNFLGVYSQRRFDKMRKRFRKSLPSALSEEQIGNEMRRFCSAFSNATIILYGTSDNMHLTIGSDLCGKAHLKQAPKGVMFVGLGGHFEIWDRQAYEEYAAKATGAERYRETLLATEPIDREFSEVLTDLFAKTRTLLAKRKQAPESQQELIGQLRAEVEQARRRISNFSRRGRKSVTAQQVEILRKQALEHVKKAEAMIERYNEPAALQAFLQASIDIQAAREKALYRRFARQDKLPRITVVRDKREVYLTQQTYQLRGKARVAIGNYRPKKYQTLWQVFRSLDDQRRTELDDYRFLKAAIDKMERLANTITGDAVAGIESELSEITRALNPERGDIKSEPKRLARIYIREAIELYNADANDAATGFLRKAINLFGLRIIEIERILANLEKGHLNVLRLEARRWHSEIRGIADTALVGLKVVMWDDAQNRINELLAHPAINEPQFWGLKLLLQETLRAFTLDKARYAGYIKYNLELIRRKAGEADRLVSFMADFRSEWVKECLRQTDSDVNTVEESVFMLCFEKLIHRHGYRHGSYDEEKWWTRCFQPAFIPTTIAPAHRRAKAIDNPVFLAVSDLIVMQEVREFGRLTEEYKGRLPKAYEAITEIMKDTPRANMAILTRLGLPDRKRQLLDALAGDYGLTDAQKQVLYRASAVPAATAKGAGEESVNDVKEELRKYGIIITEAESDFRGVPNDAEWAMFGIRPQEFRPICETSEDIPEIELVYPLDKLPLLARGDRGTKTTKGVFLGFAKFDNIMQPVVIKLFTSDYFGSFWELIAAQLLDRLGVGPRFYGVIKNESKHIIGYAMQFVPGRATILESFDSHKDFAKISERTEEVGLALSGDWIRTITGGLCVIDSGDISVGDEGKYEDFIQRLNEQLPVSERYHRVSGNGAGAAAKGAGEAVERPVAVITDSVSTGRDIAEILLELKGNFDTFVRKIPYNINPDELKALIKLFKDKDYRVVVKVNNRRLEYRIRKAAKELVVEAVYIRSEDKKLWRQRLSQM